MLSLCVTPGYAQEIYKVVNQDGSVTYTDKPVVNAEPVELGPDNRMSTPTPQPQPVQTATTTSKASKPKPVIEVVQPKPEATVRNNAGNMTIAANVSNADKQGKFKLYINDSLDVSNSNAT